ncbi:hypothetical protein F4679DRAFT_558090 [Xylaria curta]|nr:hypothetical protein F4679DRAFT_558090 [Xylaria curta]
MDSHATSSNYRTHPRSEKGLDAGIQGISANIRPMSSPPSTQYGAELESSERGGFTVAADSAVESGSLSSQGDETTNPTDLELASDKSAQSDEQEGLRDEEYSGDDHRVVNYILGPLSAARLEPGELLCGIGASLAAQERIRGPFTGNISHPNGFLVLDHEHGNGVFQDTMPAKELPCVNSNINNELESILEGTKFCCITQRCTGLCDLYLHRGRDEFVARWPFGSEIKYSIDYNSFGTRNDANYALNQLQFAIGTWNSHNIGVQFNFVEPNEPIESNQSPIIFRLKYKRAMSRDKMIFAKSFFPIDVERRRPCKLYIFGVSFDGQYRGDMWRTFLHEIAHILGGRHENAPERERDSPFVLLGSRNDQSVLVGDREPSTINLHPEDIEWFKNFMGYPEGSSICDPDGRMVPIRDIAL